MKFPPSLSAGIALLAALVLAACGPAGSPAGTPCTVPNQCASRLCIARTATTSVCTDRCSTTADCPTTGDVCGRFDFRGQDPDSGAFTGPVEDVLHACRPRLNTICNTTAPCTTVGQVCLGTGSGVCTTRCTQDSDCTSRLCIPAVDGAACGTAGSCAPLCDDLVECPTGWYCNLSGADFVGHGRCEPIDPITGADAGCDL